MYTLRKSGLMNLTLLRLLGKYFLRREHLRPRSTYGGMQDLRAEVTSGLLQFPKVTTEALGKHGRVLESLLCGKLAAGNKGLAFLTCGPELEVVSSVTGECLSAYRFSGVNEEPPTVLAVKEFSWQKRTGLLIGLGDAEGSVLCLYDLGRSRVVKALVLPGKVTAIEPISNHGGASPSSQRLHPSLRWLFGVATVGTNVGQILLIDLCLDDLSYSQNEVEASDLEVMAGFPADVPRIRESAAGEGRHLCFPLVSPSGKAVSTLSYVNRTNQLVAGFSDGCLELWNMGSMKREYCAQLEGGRAPVQAVTFQEPEDDPRNCCYLWAFQSAQDREENVLSLHLLQLVFGDRQCLASGQALYERFEYCEERYTLDLIGGMFPLRGPTRNPKLLGCQSIEKFPSRDDREEGTREALSPDTSVSIFTWQVTMYGQGKPSIYLGIFDINSWYHAQMPDSLRSGEYLNNCSYFALWSLDSVASRTSHSILDILVHERSLSRGICPSYSPPEEFLNPSSYNFDATCLLNSGVVHVSCTGIQKKTLNFLKESAPFLSEVVSEGYNQCLVAGLLSPVHTGLQPSSLSQEEKLKALFSAAIRTSSLGVLTGCVRRWVTEEQPNSAANLCFVLEWTWTQVILTKEEFDRLCTPLFDGSCRFIGPQTAQSIQQCHLRLRNLSTALRCFAKVAKGHVNLTTKCMVSQLIDQYEQVVVWFFHSGLLPEGLGDAVQVSRLCYNYPAIHSYYVGRRQQCKLLSRGKWNPDCLMIDGMVSQLGDRVKKLWKRDEGGTGKYPPPSLHALLDIYLLDNITEERKHFIKRNVSIESFQMAFAISWNQVKLIQGFWLIDHNDYEKGLDLLFHPATAKPEPWQHSKVIEAFLSQGEPRRALRYIQTMKPAVTSESDITLHLTVLLSNRCMMEAWSVLRQHSDGADREGLLKHTYSVCQEMGLVEDLLRFPLTDTEQEGLVRFLQSSTSAQSREFLLVHHLQRASYIPALKLNQTLKMSVANDRDPHLRERSAVRNAMLDEYGKVLPRVHRRLAIERASPAHVSTCIQSGTQPKPLSAVLKPAVGGNVLARSTFIHNVLPTIGEIWKNDEPKTSTLGYKSPWDSVVGPGPQPSLSLGFIQQPPTGFPWNLTSSSLPASSQLTGSHRNNSRASEFHLLETPAIIKKAKTSAMSVTSSGFFELTPHSTPSSGLGSIPSAPPSQPPDRPVTRPLRSQESRTSFVEEGVTMKCITGAADGGRTKVLTPIPSRKCALSGETQRLKNEYPTSPLSSREVDHEEVEVRSQNMPSQCWEKLDKSKGNSSVSSDSLEYYDAPSPGGFECKFMASKPGSSSTELIPNLSEETEKDSDKDVFESNVAPGDLEKQMAVADVLDDSGSSGLIVSASSVMSEHSLDQEITMSFKDDHEIEVVLKESTDLAEENPPIPDSQEFHRPLRSSRLRKPPTTDTTSRKEVKTPKRMKNSLENQESVERGPGVRNKRLRLTEVETSEVAGHDLDRKARGQRRPVHRSKRGGKRDLRAVGLREDAQRDASRVTLQAKADVPATPRKRGRPRKTCASEDVGSEAAKEERSPKRRKALSTQKRSTRNTPAARKNRGVGKRTLKKSGLVPNEELVTVMSSKRKTERVEYHSQKRSVRSVSEKYTEEEKVTKEPRDREEKLPAKTALPPFPYSTRTRSHKTILLPDFSKPVNQPLFSPPESKGSRKEKAKKIDAPDQLKESASDLPSARAVSPPALRTRRKSVCRAPRRVREQDDGAVGQQKGKRIRTEKWKQASKIAEKESSWSPPPVEIKLISPLAAPTDRVKSGPGKTGEVTGRPLRGNRKKASSFPKQIVRRKML